MGVLEINVGDAVTPDWRKIGCGGVAGTTGRLKLWDGTRWMREACDSDTGPTITDNFNRADNTSTLGTPWTMAEYTLPTHASTWGIASNQAKFFSTSDGGATGVAWVDAGSGDIDLSVTWSGLSSNEATGIIFRSNAALSAFWYLSRNNVGNTISGDTFSGSGYVSGETARVLCSGDHVTVWRNGVLWYSSNSTAETAAVGLKTNSIVGLRCYSLATAPTAIRWDDFTVTVPPERHPLKMWDGTTWQTVACMTPA